MLKSRPMCKRPSLRAREETRGSSLCYEEGFKDMTFTEAPTEWNHIGIILTYFCQLGSWMLRCNCLSMGLQISVCFPRVTAQASDGGTMWSLPSQIAPNHLLPGKRLPLPFAISQATLSLCMEGSIESQMNCLLNCAVQAE